MIDSKYSTLRRRWPHRYRRLLACNAALWQRVTG